MNFALFYHSVVSDWNHGNAHFLRGYATELVERGHSVVIHEPRGGWSLENLRAEQGMAPTAEYLRKFPLLSSRFYDPDTLDLDSALDGVDVAIVHEWSSPAFVARIGRHRARTGAYRLLFHDTHHRSSTRVHEMSGYDLSGFDGVLAFGEVIRRNYLERGWARRAWTWHEAADTRVFAPVRGIVPEVDLVWIGNWGDGEREAELEEFLLKPVRDLKLRARIHGVRYPESARRALAEAGIEHAGWIPNFRVPDAFGRARVTVHVPRRPYREALRGVPTIRVFEALACGIPLISAPWDDAERLFRPGSDYLVARDAAEMREHLSTLLAHPDLARSMAERGLATVLARHTCAHRVEELSAVLDELGVDELRSRARDSRAAALGQRARPVPASKER
jgi:spore maturation protein CgeB